MIENLNKSHGFSAQNVPICSWGTSIINLSFLQHHVGFIQNPLEVLQGLSRKHMGNPKYILTQIQWPKYIYLKPQHKD